MQEHQAKHPRPPAFLSILRVLDDCHPMSVNKVIAPVAEIFLSYSDLFSQVNYATQVACSSDLAFL